VKRILSIDGGGSKGLIPTAVLAAVEDVLRAPIYTKFDLIVGTSVGAIIGGMLSSGAVSASTLKGEMYKELREIFKWRLRLPVLQPKYSRKPIDNLLNAYIPGVRMKQCRTRFLCTGVNIVDGRTHFFKSWEQKDGEIPLVEAIMRSAAAPLYFGSMIDKQTQSVWLDGGTGDMWSPAMEAFIEVMRQEWLGTEHVHMLSIGCGQHSPQVPFDTAKKYKNIRQVNFYAQVTEGGLARVQMGKTQTEWLKNLAKHQSLNFTFQRLEDLTMAKELDKMDAIKYRDDYIRIGEKLAQQVDYQYLR
jgi:hypothetical protein